ncbi:acyl dehydratase [Haloprofundus marisrubri]|uniref:Acyl dehydratase n=1 Tax=Haloprofundus marisrubri TaxID=1514971 RepID=A0A0W1R525_9EURY|nr:MaoC family dehydratase [Haloprofundus marisrubri]KTG08347.1 acyl dehydratase [Haloprofundus marisrubri]
MPIYFEDLEVGETTEFGEYEVTEEEIIEFAERYDPQFFHVDSERASETMYGGLIASGWHTASMTMRMLVDGFLSEAASMGAKGVDELRWYRPVRPGDVLTLRNEVLEKEVESDERGLAHVRTTTTNQEGEDVFSMVGLVMFGRKPESLGSRSG